MDLSKYTPSIVESLVKLIKIKTVLDTPVEGGPFGQGNKDCLEETLRASGKESLAKYITIGGSAITFMIIFKMLSECIVAIKTTFTL